MPAPPPPSVLAAQRAAKDAACLSRTEFLAAIFARSGTRPVYGIDDKGHGGRFDLGDKKTDAWVIPVSTLVMVCIAGEPWERVPVTE